MTIGVFTRAADLWDARTRPWHSKARPEQLPPEGWRRAWYIRGGRGGGKTWTGAHNLADLILTYTHDKDGAPTEWAVIAPTIADARDTCIEGRSGLLHALGLPRLYEGWNRSQGQLRLPTGQMIYAGAADDGAFRVQGKNLSGAWCDEIGLWKQWRTAWDESIRFAVRIAPARIIATGTPKRGMPAMALIKRLLADPGVPKSLLRTQDNAENLDPELFADVLSMAGTPLGRQELEGEVLEEAEGALWTNDEEKAQTLGLGLIVHGDLPADGLGRRVLAVDPSDGEQNSDEYALAVATIGADGVGYLLASDGVRLGPDGNVAHTATMFDRWECDVVVVEKNHGGQYLPAMLRAAGLPVQVVTASVGKRTRAEPVAARYGTHAAGVVHVGAFEVLEDQMVSFTGAPNEVSPDRLDAAVWALSSLYDAPSRPRMSFAGRAA